jgi:glycosyl transferase family 25
MRAQLDSLGLDYEFFRAVDGSDAEHLGFPNYSDEFCLKAWRRPLTPGEVGCFASHYSLWRKCVDGDEPMIVMEDDVEVAPRLSEAARQLLPDLAQVGYVRLAGLRAQAFRAISRELPVGWKLVRFLAGPMGTQCYALFPRGAARFLAGAHKWTLPVDNYMDGFWEHGVSCVGLQPFVVSIPRSFESSISPGGTTPSALLRGRVWRPKRFLARKASDFRRYRANLEYAVGLRNAGWVKDGPC